MTFDWTKFILGVVIGNIRRVSVEFFSVGLKGATREQDTEISMMDNA
jgi:hypothetical protein